MGHELNGSHRRSARVAALGLGGALVLGLSGCSSALQRQAGRVGLIDPASDRAHYMSDFWVGAWITAGIVGVLVAALIIYAAIKFRRKPGNQVPRQTHYHVPLEVLYTIVPILIIVGLFFFNVKAENRVLAKDATPQHTIHVVGQKWSWTFNYMEKDNSQIGAVAHEGGTIDKIPDLYLPVNQSVRFNITSADVDHSFWVPAFYFKLDAIPGHPNSFDLTPTKLGTFDGKCAELCGTYHSAMLFTVHVVSVEEYNAHVKKLIASGQTGELNGAVDANHLPATTEEKK